MERVTGIGPVTTAWEAVVLPLNYTRKIFRQVAFNGDLPFRERLPRPKRQSLSFPQSRAP